VADDGIVGAKTVVAVNACNPRSLFDTLKERRIEYIDNIIRRTPSNERFRKGWMNRLNALKFEE
jgi:lysozyme family protein